MIREVMRRWIKGYFFADRRSKGVFCFSCNDSVAAISRTVNDRFAQQSAEMRFASKACALSVGGGILDAPFACSTVTRGVKDAAPYEQ